MEYASARSNNANELPVRISRILGGVIFADCKNVIERSVIVGETENFSVDESWLRPPLATGPKSHFELSQTLAAHEKEMIEAVLSECGGRVFGPSGAAAKLGMPRSTLESKIRSLKINKRRFKSADSSKSD